MAVAAEVFQAKGTRLTSEQFHDALDQQLVQLVNTAGLPEEALEILTSMHEMNSLAKGKKKWGYYRNPHIIAHKYVAMMSDGAFAFIHWFSSHFGENYCYHSLAHLGEMYQHAVEVKSRNRKVGDAIEIRQVGHSVNAIRRYIRELVALGLMECNHEKRQSRFKKGTTYGREITWLRLTQKAWDENESYLIGNNIMKPKDMSPTTPPIHAGLLTPFSAAASSNSASPSSFFNPKTPSESDTKLGDNLSDSHTKSRSNVSDSDSKNKNQLDRELRLQQRDQIRSAQAGSNTNKQTKGQQPAPSRLDLKGEGLEGVQYLVLTEQAEFILLLTQQYLDPLTMYKSPQIRTRAIAEARSSAQALADHPLLAQSDDRMLATILCYQMVSPWATKFKQRCPNIPIQAKHLLMTELLEQLIDEIERENWQPEWMIAQDEEQARQEAAQAQAEWEAAQAQQQQEQRRAPEPEPKPKLVVVVPNVTLQPSLSDILTTEEDATYENIPGMPLRFAFRLLARIKEQFPQLEAQSHPGNNLTKVITVIYEGERITLTSWEEYQEIREVLGFEPDPDPIRSPQVPGQSKEEAAATTKKYLRRCSELRKENGEPEWNPGKPWTPTRRRNE